MDGGTLKLFVFTLTLMVRLQNSIQEEALSAAPKPDNKTSSEGTKPDSQPPLTKSPYSPRPNYDTERYDCRYADVANFVRLSCVQKATNKVYIKCPNSDTLYYQNNQSTGYKDKYSGRCPNDPFHYQACGAFQFERRTINETNWYLCKYYVCDGVHSVVSSGGFDELAKRCTGENECKDGIDERYCPDNTTSADIFVCQRQRITPAELCDGRCQCMNCNDEMECNGYFYGYRCRRRPSKTILPDFYCDGERDCPGGDDEEECSSHPNVRCALFNDDKGRTLLLTNFTRCFAWVMCANKHDQLNCSDVSLTPLWCTVRGYWTTVSENIICNQAMLSLRDDRHTNSTAVCDNGIDQACYSPSSYCTVHKHKLCDGRADCMDGSDEENIYCNEMIDQTCQRFFSYDGEELPIPFNWLGDGLKDCADGIDEMMKLWPACRYGTLSRLTYTGDCEDGFLCNSYPPSFVDFVHLCDKTESCGNEAVICKAVHQSSVVLHEVLHYNEVYHTFFCLPGLMTKCMEERYPKFEVLGTSPNRLVVPTFSINCDHIFGENYVFLSCLGRCENAECPVREMLRADSCPKQFLQRTYSLADDNYLTFVKKNQDRFTVQNLFECRNGWCIPYSEVCDLTDNCGDNSDEVNCTNNFVCEPDIIPLSSVCDDKLDCSDLSDECNKRCNKEVIGTVVLKLFSWTIGSLAAILNGIIIIINLRELKDVTSTIGFFNRILIVLISFGDWIVGGYLLSISVIDYLFSGNYCHQQREWLVSSGCAALGVISTTGSQISLFSMTVLSLFRLSGIASFSTPRDINLRSKITVSIVVIAIALLSTILSIIPLLPVFEDTFINAIYFPNNPLFKGLTRKEDLGRVLNKYYGRVKLNIADLSWKNLRKLTSTMFTDSHGGLKWHNTHFYGNDGVCLFKYFVLPSDPQMFYSWTLLGINFVCFMIISASYIYVNIMSLKSVSRISHGRGALSVSLKERNKKIQQRISIIIITDFICWVPFILISALHTLRIIDGTSWYALFSIIILPINSIINPLLYSDSLPKLMKSTYDYIRSATSYSTTTVVSADPQCS